MMHGLKNIKEAVCWRREFLEECVIFFSFKFSILPKPGWLKIKRYTSTSGLSWWWCYYIGRKLKRKYMVTFWVQKAGRSRNIDWWNFIWESGTTLKNQNSIREEIKSRLKSGNACNHSMQNLLSSSLLSKNLKIKIYIINLPVVLYGCETWSLTLREECSWGCWRIFRSKRDEVTGEWREERVCNKELHDVYCSPNIVRVIKSSSRNSHPEQRNILRQFPALSYLKYFSTTTDTAQQCTWVKECRKWCQTPWLTTQVCCHLQLTSHARFKTVWKSLHDLVIRCGLSLIHSHDLTLFYLYLWDRLEDESVQYSLANSGERRNNICHEISKISNQELQTVSLPQLCGVHSLTRAAIAALAIALLSFYYTS